ncbi:DUF6346 domain-containing protein, partial [Amycolatopsis rhizosphaerae]|uniref:DUF6346 domain-containing protein n=1 Tax=Amycolatopsis rhizosphaerae TaxID=2053003 RepID=UPI001FE4A580
LSRLTAGGGPEADRFGSASVLACVHHGPVSVYGFGDVYGCVAEVRWSGGGVERAEFAPGVLTPGEEGVPVYRDGSVYGRDGAAWPVVLRPLALVVAGAAAVVLGAGTAYALVRVVRPVPGPPRPETGRTRAGQQRLAGRRAQRDWPVTPADRAAVPLSRRVLRLRLLSAWCALVVPAVPLSMVPRFDAPRAPRFVSPWPQIARARLADLSPGTAVVLGAILAVLFAAMAGAARTDAARIVRHGPAYLARDLPGKGSAEAKLRRALDGRDRAHRIGTAVGGSVLLAVAAWAAFRGFGAASGPLAVWLACLTDAILLTLLAAIFFATLESPRRRIEHLLGTDVSAKGTKGDLLAS